MADLFDTPPADGEPARNSTRPLADRIRPARLADVIGQDKVLGLDGPLGAMLDAGSLSSLILWGPPGVVKTTIARLLAQETDLAFVQISAIFSGVPELRKVFDAARVRRQQGRGTLLFVDEIHRFNKAQQDSFLPHMEDGTITLPKHDGLLQDHRAFKLVRGVARIPEGKTEGDSHGDRAMACVYAHAAAKLQIAPIGYIEVPGHARGFDNLASQEQQDHDFRIPEAEGW